MFLDPAVLQHLADSDTLFGIVLEAESDEFLDFFREVLGKIKLAFKDLLLDSVFALLIEGRCSSCEFVGEDTDGPEIN